MKKIKIDFVSDVACPWCAVGLGALEMALERVKDEIQAEIHFQPFELNPQMPAGGQDTLEHLSKKYGSTPEQMKANQKQIRDRANAVGFPFHEETRPRIYNTFNCHRLLHWAGLELGGESQHKLKTELLKAYFTYHHNMDDFETLLLAVDRAGLDRIRANEVLINQEFVAEVKELEQHYTGLGISAVPSIIFNDKHLLQGGQPVEMFEQAIRQLASENS
jgi:predicted DsbA family dithiol-disulfide isomerase